ncbi:MAG: GTPase [Acholeplasmataceae bacterium]|jgi:ribosome biogenesis GTPase A|nr:GTPase [Acholeplasmataceae bacterium]
MSTVNKCLGCGALLQTTDQHKVGYALSLEHTYCQSCYRLLHYGEGSIHFHPEDLPKLEPDSIIFMISSILHIDLLLSYPVHRYQPDAKYVYIINQIDLLPKSTNFDLLIENITNQAKKQGVPFIDIILMSAKNEFDINNLKAYIKSYKEKHMYLVGVQNSGKTTIFKALTGTKEALAFKKAGLTQEALIGNFSNKVIYDLPGLYQAGYLHQFLPYEVYKRLIPETEINPKIYQLKSNQSLFIEGLCAITFLKDINITLYLEKTVHIHKTNQSRIKQLLEEKEKHFKIFVDEYIEQAFKVPTGKHQVTFADMGFMHLVGPLTIKMIIPKHMHISMTEALFQ